MSVQPDAICSHCLLPIYARAMRRSINGEERAFCCYGCCIAYQVKNGSGEESEAAWLLIRFGAGAFLSMNIMLLSLLIYANAFTGADSRLIPWVHLLLLVLATAVLAVLGGPFAREVCLEGRDGRLSSSALIVLGVGAAYVYSVVSVIMRGPHVYFDTVAMVLMLFTLGRYLEAAGRARAARDLGDLFATQSEWATVSEGNAQRRLGVREISAGMIVRVRPGERVPVDGVVVEGESHINEALMTGESRPVAKSIGCAVLAGSINLDGLLLVRSTGAADESRWAQICRSVREALNYRTPLQRAADRAMKIFVPIVLSLSGLTVWYWARWLTFGDALLNGLSVLVVACPCALGLAAPMAASLGIGRLAQRGCVVRRPGALEALASVRLFAFDKTGTLTSGQAHLAGIAADNPASEDEALARAAGLELDCGHALAYAIAEAAAVRGISPIAARARIVPGRGVHGIADNQVAAVGSRALMCELGWSIPPGLAQCAGSMELSGHSVVYVGWEQQVRAVLWFDDTPLPEARSTMDALRRLGMRVALLTGDLPAAAMRVAAVLGIIDVEAGLSPEAKRSALERRRQKDGAVAMVGDGLNDGLVLAGADVGIAVGSAADLARAAADIVLPTGGLRMLPWVVDIARAVRATTLTSLAWAFGYNMVTLTLAACGLLRPIAAAAIMAGSSIFVVLNSLRLERLSAPVSPDLSAPHSVDALTKAPADAGAVRFSFCSSPTQRAVRRVGESRSPL
jgi:Cu2+-exporting ATPase